EQTLRVTRVTDLGLNPLSADTRQRINAYGDRLTATERAANRLVASVTSAVDGPVVSHDADAPFRRWSTGFSTEQLAQR
ncbi:hypothetical protein, partial [Pseudomonas sp. HY13-MNA-CIBAN-0226]